MLTYNPPPQPNQKMSTCGKFEKLLEFLWAVKWYVTCTLVPD